jgi:hypothetical protein
MYKQDRTTQATSGTTIVKGLAEESKAGLVVDGVVLIELEDFEKYIGKNVIAEGKVNTDHPWSCNKPRKLITPCFDGPVLQDMKYIKIVDSSMAVLKSEGQSVVTESGITITLTKIFKPLTNYPGDREHYSLTIKYKDLLKDITFDALRSGQVVEIDGFPPFIIVNLPDSSVGVGSANLQTDRQKAISIAEKKILEEFPNFERSGYKLELIRAVPETDTKSKWFLKYDVVEGMVFDASVEMIVDIDTGEISYYKDSWA